MNRKASFNAVARLITALTDEEQSALVDNPTALGVLAKRLVEEAKANTFFVALSDDEAVELLIKNRKADVNTELLLPPGEREDRALYQAMVAKYEVAGWRKLASDFGYTGPVAWKVRAGFTLKQHAPQASPCYEQFGYLQDWELKNDEPTVDSIVFWVPRLLEGSVSKDVEEQKALMTDVRARYELPEGHLSCFGSAVLIAGLILAHFKRTGERTPLRNLYVRSDTILADGGRLGLGGFDGTGLDCSSWDYDGGADEGVGVFALGVEALGSSDPRP